MRHSIFITGGTGYMGTRLIPLLAGRGHRVRAVVRPGSERKLAPGATCVSGNILDHASYRSALEGCDTFIHLAGTPHPAPWKEKQFRAVDLVSLQQSARAASGAGIHNFVYVSVAQPAPVMRSYIRVRQECEACLRDARLPANILRPWYVLGPGHWWPLVLIPGYRLLEAIPATGASAVRLGLVRLSQMILALVWAAVNPPGGDTRVLGVAEIRKLSRTPAGAPGLSKP